MGQKLVGAEDPSLNLFDRRAALQLPDPGGEAGIVGFSTQQGLVEQLDLASEELVAAEDVLGNLCPRGPGIQGRRPVGKAGVINRPAKQSLVQSGDVSLVGEGGRNLT